MYSDLPDLKKQQVADFLAQGDFVAAKNVYDQWQRSAAAVARSK